MSDQETIYPRNTLVTFSPTGTSGMVGHILAKAIWQEGYKNIDLTLPAQFAAPSPLLECSTPTIFVVPVYAGRVAPLAVERMKHIRGTGTTPAIVVVVYGNRDYEDALLELKNIVSDAGFIPCAGAACIGEHSYSRKANGIAVGRPDQADEERIIEFGQQIKNLLEKDTVLPIDVPGNSEYRPGVGPASFHPVVVKEGCTSCGICVASCPVGIVEVDDEEPVWQNGCIRCCACIKSCPENVLEITEPRVVELARLLVEKCATRREPEFFL